MNSFIYDKQNGLILAVAPEGADIDKITSRFNVEIDILKSNIKLTNETILEYRVNLETKTLERKPGAMIF